MQRMPSCVCKQEAIPTKGASKKHLALERGRSLDNLAVLHAYLCHWAEVGTKGVVSTSTDVHS
jgi:hypothetical protein